MPPPETQEGDHPRWVLCFLPKKMSEGASGPAIPLLAAAAGGSAFAIGAMEFAFSALMMLGSFVWGRTSDEVRKRKAFIVLGFGATAVALVGLALSRTFVELAAWRAVQGFVLAAYVAVGGALVAEGAKPANIGARMGQLNLVGGVGYCVGLVLGALVVTGADLPALYLLAAVLSGIATLLAVLLIREPETFLRRRDVHRIFRNVAVPFLMPISRRVFSPVVLFHRPKLTHVERRAWTYLFAIFLVLVAGASTFALFPLYLRDLGASLPLVFVVFLANSLASMALYRGAGVLADRVGYRKVQLAGIGGRAVMFALLAAPFSRSLAVVALLLVANGFAWAVIHTTGPAALFRGMEIRSKGELVGLYNIAVALGQAVGAIAGGLVVTLFGFPTVFLLSSGLAALATLITARAVYPPGAPAVSRVVQAPSPVPVVTDGK